MCKVIIDSFENQAEAVAFTYWLSKQMMDDKVKFNVLKGMQVTPVIVYWDGVDQDQTDHKQVVVNITSGAYDQDDL